MSKIRVLGILCMTADSGVDATEEDLKVEL